MFGRVLGRIGRRGVILAAAALGVAMVAAPVPALAATGNVTCTTEIDSTTITGNVTVPAGAFCFLNGDTVEGSVAVGEGALGILGGTTVDGSVAAGEDAGFVAFGAVIQRNLSTEGALAVEVAFSTVYGNSSFDATSGNLSICGTEVSLCVGFTINPGIPNPNPNGTANKFGNVSITNTSAPGGALYEDNYVAGNLSCSGNTSVFNDGGQNTVLGHESGQCAGL